MTISSRKNRRIFFLVITIAILFREVSAQTAAMSYFIIAGYALLGRAQAIQALALSWFFTTLNPGLAPQVPYLFVLRYLVLGAAAASVLFRSHFLFYFKPKSAMVKAVVFLSTFFVAHSVLFSPIISVSILKAVSWAIAMGTLFAAWAGLASEERNTLSHFLFKCLIAIMITSVPLLLVPQIGYLRNGSGFQGILSHPQAFGPAMALLGAWTASRLFVYKRPPWSYVALALTCMILVVLSEARTAGVAMVAGIGISFGLSPVIAKTPIRKMLPGLISRRGHIVIGMGLIGLIMAVPVLNQVADRFISKGTQASSIVAAYEVSRGALIDRMWENIRAQPFQGIGFGIASNPAYMDVERDPIFHLPVSASVEKGVMPLAVLEETGIFGFIAVTIWIWMLLRKSAYGGAGPLAVTTTALLMNMGESTLFSPGGMGLLSMVLIGWAGASGDPKKHLSRAVTYKENRGTRQSNPRGTALGAKTL
jgi:hypothetical protein